MSTHDIPAGAVVVGVDGSHDSDHAVDWAARHAKNEGRDLVLLHAVNGSSSTVAWMTSGGMDPTEYLSQADAAGQAIADTAAARVAPERPDGAVQTLVVRADPRTALLEASALASTVVVGSRGRGPVKSLLLGSVGVAVAAHGQCPVVVVRPHHPGKVRRGVLVGADATSGSLAVLEFGFRHAAEQALPLTVVHTVWDSAATVTNAHEIGPDDPAYAGAALALAESLAGLAEKYPDVPVAKSLVRGMPTAGILALADTMNLVVVGHQRQDPISRAFFGSVAMGVLEHANSVVAVIPES